MSRALRGLRAWLAMLAAAALAGLGHALAFFLAGGLPDRRGLGDSGAGQGQRGDQRGGQVGTGQAMVNAFKSPAAA